MVCAGSKSDYGVVSLYHGMSDFKWRVYHSFINSSNIKDTIFVDATDISLFARGDSIEVFWDESKYIGGIYTLEVTETNDFGCSGPRYTTDLMLNTNTIYFAVEGNDYLFTGCDGKPITLNAGYFGQDSRYLWTGYPDSTKQTFITTTAGTYQVRIVDGNSKSCSYDTLRAFFNPLPYVWLGNDTTLFANQTLTLDVTDPDFNAYKWYNNGVDLNLNPLTSTLTVDGLSGNRTYKVTVTDLNGCTNSDEIDVNAANMNNLHIPAAFTPNGDMINDVWAFPRSNIQGVDQDLYQYFNGADVKVDIKVYSRWGKLVWHTPVFKLWDGKDLNGRDLPMDSYHYIIVIDFNGKQYNYKGSVTIIR